MTLEEKALKAAQDARCTACGWHLAGDVGAVYGYAKPVGGGEAETFQFCFGCTVDFKEEFLRDL